MQVRLLYSNLPFPPPKAKHRIYTTLTSIQACRGHHSHCARRGPRVWEHSLRPTHSSIRGSLVPSVALRRVLRMVRDDTIGTPNGYSELWSSLPSLQTVAQSLPSFSTLGFHSSTPSGFPSLSLTAPLSPLPVPSCLALFTFPFLPLCLGDCSGLGLSPPLCHQELTALHSLLSSSPPASSASSHPHLPNPNCQQLLLI